MTGTSLVTYEQKWEDRAEKAVASEPLTGGQWLSVKGGQLMIGEQALPGNQAALIVLDSVKENTYYGARFDPDAPLPPICYALARDADDLFPHVDMQKDMSYFYPQHWSGVEGKSDPLGCQGCPMNEWGSAAQGRGKACQNRRRLSVIPAGYYTAKRGSRDMDLTLMDDEKHFKLAELAFFKLPVTSVANWSKYVNQLSGSVRRPPYGVVTRVFLEPHAQHQYEVCFEMIDVVPDYLADIIMDRNDAAQQMPLLGYQPPDAERLAKNKAGSVRGGGGSFRQGSGGRR